MEKQFYGIVVLFFIFLVFNGIKGASVSTHEGKTLRTLTLNGTETKQNYDCPSYCDYCSGSTCYYYDYEDDLGLAVGWIIAIIIVGLIITFGIPIAICFCCGYCCFAACRKQQQPQTIYIQGPPPPGWQPTGQQVITTTTEQQPYPPQNYNN